MNTDALKERMREIRTLRNELAIMRKERAEYCQLYQVNRSAALHYRKFLQSLSERVPEAKEFLDRFDEEQGPLMAAPG